MRDQIINLFFPKAYGMPDCEAATRKQKLVVQTLKEEISCLHYQFRIEYLGHEHKNCIS
jgi:hypothetical protein